MVVLENNPLCPIKETLVNINLPLANSADQVFIMFILKAIKSHLKGHMINRLLQYSIYETRQSSFHEFHMKRPLMLDMFYTNSV